MKITLSFEKSTMICEERSDVAILKIGAKSKKNILLIVQNISFPFDKRVYKEAISLNEAGYGVTVISPVSEIDKEKRIVIDGIDVVRYKNILSKGSIAGFFNEYFFSILKIYLIVLRLHLKKHFAVVHVANPPDFFWPVALFCKISGAKFIYDQHDLSPEIYRNKFGKGILYHILSLNEWLTVLFSNKVIPSNQSFKERLEKKWGKKPDKYMVVYNSPADNFEPAKNGALIQEYSGKKIILYIGLMTKNDNIEILIEAAERIVKVRSDCVFILLGSGDVESEMKSESEKRGLIKFVQFKGYVGQRTVMEYLYIADVGIAPDLPNGLNENLTLVKVLEYMKAGKPFVTFKLHETMTMAQDSGLYASNVEEFVSNILFLLDNPAEAKKLGEKGKTLVNQKYLWSNSEKVLLNLYGQLLSC